MGRLTISKIAVTSLMLATAAVRAETPTYLYGTTSIQGVGPVTAIATTTPTSSNPRAAYVVAAVSYLGVLDVLAWADTGSSLVNIGGALVPNGLTVKSVAATGLDANRVVTADVDETGALSINTWTIGTALPPNGVAQQQGYTTGPGVASAVSVATVSSTQIVTAIVDFSGKLAVQEWTISAGGLPTPIGEPVYDDNAAGVAIAAISSDQVITAVSRNNNSLTVTTWAVDSAGVSYRNDYVVKNTVNVFSGDVAIAAGSQLVLETIDGLPSLQTVRSAFTPVLKPDGHVDVYYWDISASGTISLLSKAQTPKEDLLQVAACMLRTDVPITAFGDAYSDAHVGWYGNGTDYIYNAVKGNKNSITSIGAAAEGSDYKVYLPDFNAYFVTGVVTTHAGSQTNLDLQIRVWSYPVSDLDL